MQHAIIQTFARSAAIAVLALTAFTAKADISEYPYTPSYNQLATDGWEGYISNSYQGKVPLGYSSS